FPSARRCDISLNRRCVLLEGQHRLRHEHGRHDTHSTQREELLHRLMTYSTKFISAYRSIAHGCNTAFSASSKYLARLSSAVSAPVSKPLRGIAAVCRWSLVSCPCLCLRQVSRPTFRSSSH